MLRIIAGLISIIYLSACSKTADIDSSTVIIGSWKCDDGIIITFNTDGQYEWRVPANEEFELDFKESDSMRRNDDGGYSILDKWRLADSQLEMDMWGETDTYKTNFESETKVQFKGAEQFTCNKIELGFN